MDHFLTVVSDFAHHTIGARIEDPAEIAAVLASPNRSNVVKTFKPVEEPAPEGEAETPAADEAPAETDPAPAKKAASAKTDGSKG